MAQTIFMILLVAVVMAFMQQRADTLNARLKINVPPRSEAERTAMARELVEIERYQLLFQGLAALLSISMVARMAIEAGLL